MLEMSDEIEECRREKFFYLSLAMLEFLDIDFGDISKSESDR
jgi:hypothetical protein